MIESPSSTAIIESKPPAYADEPDATLEKEPLMPAEADADRDVEITVINHKPITANIRNTIGHLHRVGGFRARWRGLGTSILYHALHGGVAALLSSFVGFGLFGNALVYIFTSVALSRFHMLWTHAMIAHPTTKPFYRRMVSRKQCKAILLPSLVFATAQQATLIAPLAVAFALGLPQDHMHHLGEHSDCARTAFQVLRVLAVPATAIAVALAVLLPAAVTLTRIEATLLPEDQESIVPFDRQAILGSVDIAALQRGDCKVLFVQAWRSFDRAARLRVIKLYAKMVLIQITIVVVAAHVMLAELYLIGGERIAMFVKSAGAQVQLAVIEAKQKDL